MPKLRFNLLSALFGLFVIVSAVAISPSGIVEIARTEPTALEIEQLTIGAWLFKLGLVVLGVTIVLLARSRPVPHRPALSGAGSGGAPGIDLAIMLLITGLGAALRLYQLDAGLWLDEIYTHLIYARMPFGELITSYASENQHFLYSLMARTAYLLVGESAWSLRLPAVLFGLASVWALYFLGRQVSDRREAILAAALMSLTYHHLWFSQNARGYSGLLFWTILSSWLLLRAMDAGAGRTWFFYGLSAALGVFTHLTMVFVIAGQFLTFLIAAWRRRASSPDLTRTGLKYGFFTAGLLTFQLHALVLPQVLSGIAGTESVVDAWKQPLWTLLEFIQGLEISFVNGAVAVGALVVFAAGLIDYARTRPALLSLLAIPPILGGGLVILVGHHLWPRFFFFLLGFALLIVVRGCMLIGRYIARWVPTMQTRQAWVGTALCVGLMLGSAITLPFAYGPKQDYEGAISFIETQREPGDVIVTAGLAAVPYREYYGVAWEVAETASQLNALSAGSQRTWLVTTLPPVLASMQPDIADRIEHGYQLVQQFPGTLSGGEVLVYLSENESSAP